MGDVFKPSALLEKLVAEGKKFSGFEIGGKIFSAKDAKNSPRTRRDLAREARKHFFASGGTAR